MSDKSLLELFEDLHQDPATRAQFLADGGGFLAEHGFGALDDPLIAEAVGNVAARLPIEAAEHLSPYTVANSPLPEEYSDPDYDVDTDLGDPTTALALLASAPPPSADADEDGLDTSLDDPSPDDSTLEDSARFGTGDTGDTDLDQADASPIDDLDDDAGLDELESLEIDELDDGDLDAEDLDADAGLDEIIDHIDAASEGLDEPDELDEGFGSGAEGDFDADFEA